jgi:acetylornithine deacetylase/succinyl-diaminopimelate desuccinylase-like protein
MTEHRTAAIEYARAHQDEFLASLKELVAIPSISTDPDRAGDIRRAAEWVAARLRSLGMDNVQIFPTPLHPVVYGEWLKAKNAPTILVYGHYDVQPVDPIDLWRHDPFGVIMEGENLIGRGASDMKGQVMASLDAIEAIVRTGEFPVNVKFLFEGEEEIGSPSLEAFIRDHTDLLACDVCLNADGGFVAKDYPTITYGLRGLSYFELRVYGPKSDLHSGQFGGVIHNPAIVLAELIAGMHDKKGRIALPGFYDKVRKLSKAERAEFARLPRKDKDLLNETGAPALYGEAGFTNNERLGARPTLDVNGLYSGFTGKGSKTVLPAYAMAKISCRLVPDQDPNQVEKQMRAYLKANAPKTVKWELIKFAGSKASISELDTPWVSALDRALNQVWSRKTVFKREGGSVPIVIMFQKLLGIDSVLTGFGLPDDNLHAPNEKFHIPTWYKGIETFVHFFFNLK